MMMRAMAPRALRWAASAQRSGVTTSRLMTRPSVAPIATSWRAFSTEKVTFTFIDGEGVPTEVTAEEGQTLNDVAHDNDIELECACGGELACSTCHLIFEQEVFDKLPEISEEEEDMLDLAWGLTDTSRLGCQIKVSKDLEGTTVRIPDESNNLM
ncbi:hypothetical protein Poli38472_000381 [Pythium oligandrum]|uniref:2Fe-2S ferredoxin-type domain-containing protein n=1 Tax=Pythium oligandrum TaxID=41045 RepID=A0A8K1CBJ2_PYTOL|nr:hypothetical protein Poli38472_000381 [Pythium oligandrum]|eukprot:TMW60339.1 hypothetical protein Poli38472_000381 [Pythium oligandrum]